MLGSLCVDFVYTVERIVESGVTLASRSRDIYPGGKGLNQAVAAARAGATTCHVGAVGPDGDLLLDTLREAGVDTQDVAQIEEASGHAIIQVDDAGQNAIVIHGGSNRTLTQAQFDGAFDRVETGDWLLLQNEINSLDTVMSQAHERGLQVAMNLAPADERIHNYPFDKLQLLIVNQEEGAAIIRAQAGQPSPPDADPDATMKILVDLLPDTSIVLTMGSKGLLWRKSDNSQVHTVGSFKVQAVDETAAGDAFVGYLLAGLATDMEWGDALRRASAAGALTVTKPGAAPAIPVLADVEAFLAANS